MKKGDKVKILRKSFGCNYTSPTFQRDLLNSEPNKFPTIKWVSDNFIDVDLYTIDRGIQTWMFSPLDLELITQQENYEIY